MACFCPFLFFSVKSENKESTLHESFSCHKSFQGENASHWNISHEKLIWRTQCRLKLNWFKFTWTFDRWWVCQRRGNSIDSKDYPSFSRCIEERERVMFSNPLGHALGCAIEEDREKDIPIDSLLFYARRKVTPRYVEHWDIWTKCSFLCNGDRW